MVLRTLRNSREALENHLSINADGEDQQDGEISLARNPDIIIESILKKNQAPNAQCIMLEYTPVVS